MLQLKNSSTDRHGRKLLMFCTLTVNPHFEKQFDVCVLNTKLQSAADYENPPAEL